MIRIPNVRRKKAIRSLRKRAESLGADVSDLSDEELEQRIVENSKIAASKIAAGVSRTARGAASRIAALGRALTRPDEKP